MELPAIEPWLAGYRDNLTFEMMQFRHFTEDAIARGDLVTVRKSFQFLHRAFATGNRHVRNSVVVSFLEHLEFSGPNGQAAEQLLPKELAAERERMLEMFRRLAERPRKRSRKKGAARYRAFLAGVLIFGASAQGPTLVAQTVAQQAARRPNVVLIMTDDLGYGDLGSYGSPDARTPNIDRLAREGVRLTDSYSNGAVCTPTRAALISGRYQQRVGLEWALTLAPADRERGLAATGTSLPALLKANGYATGLIGKWHLGSKPEFGPQAHGFGEFYGFLGGAHDYYTGGVGVDGRGPSDLYENTTPLEPSGYLTDEITRRAVRFIARQADGPFFLEVAYNAVHWPFEPPDRAPSEAERASPRRLVQMPDDSVPATRQDYVRMLERADQGVGEILAALERRGLTSNTLVIFTNDNGGEWLSRNAPFFHRKGTLWEGGIRVPLIMRWPGRLPVAQTSAQPVITFDITATILAATGTRAPESYRADGIDILPILRGEAPLLERQLFWRVARPNRQQRAVRSGRWKLLVDGGQLLLFDLVDDPGERTDLAAKHPEFVKRLKHLLADWETDVDQPVRSR